MCVCATTIIQYHSLRWGKEWATVGQRVAFAEWLKLPQAKPLRQAGALLRRRLAAGTICGSRNCMFANGLCTGLQTTHFHSKYRYQSAFESSYTCFLHFFTLNISGLTSLPPTHGWCSTGLDVFLQQHENFPYQNRFPGSTRRWECAGDPNQTCAGSRHSYTPTINETGTFGFVWKVCYQKIRYGLSMFIMIIPSKLPFWGIPCNLWTSSIKGWWINLSAKSNGFRKWSCTAERFCRKLKVVLVQLVCAAMRLAPRYLRYFAANLLRARLFWYILKKQHASTHSDLVLTFVRNGRLKKWSLFSKFRVLSFDDFGFDFDIAANFNPRFGSRALTLCISSQALQAMPAPISNEPMDPNGKGLKIQNQNIPKHTKTLAVARLSP